MGTGKAIGTIHQGTIPIAIREGILEEILAYSESEQSGEIGGFLIGQLRGESPVVAIENFLPAAHTRSRTVSLTFTHETWATMTRQVEERFPDQRVVGWHHTHPGLGVFLSAHDLFIHRNFFREAWQVAMVVDPKGQELGFFQWCGSKVVDCGFVCLADDALVHAESQRQ